MFLGYSSALNLAEEQFNQYTGVFYLIALKLSLQCTLQMQKYIPVTCYSFLVFTNPTEQRHVFYWGVRGWMTSVVLLYRFSPVTDDLFHYTFRALFRLRLIASVYHPALTPPVAVSTF